MNKNKQNSKLSGIQKLAQSINDRLKSKLSRRVVLCVFTSIIVIEAILLIPSLKRREKELLSQIKQMSSGKVAWILITYPNASNTELVNHLSELMQHHPTILGGAVYDTNKQKVGTFGEFPELSLSEVNNSKKLFFSTSSNVYRYDDLIWYGKDMQTDYSIIIRHDCSNLRPELLAYISRIIGLVIIISLFLTITVWLCLEPIIINPILLLRSDLNQAGEAIYNDQEPPAFSSISLQRQDELGEVINAFELMFMKIYEAISERKKAEAALQESLEKVKTYSQALNYELEQGHQMQKNFLPAQISQQNGWEIASFFQPARQVAGDFYDVFELSNHTVGLVIADVCDKGVGAALFMSLFRSLIRVFSGQNYFEEMNEDLGSEKDKLYLDRGLATEDCYHALKAVCLTNNYIAKNHGEVGMFATLFFGVLDINNGKITYINGGHEPLFIISATGEIKEELNSTGPAVGMLPDMKFQIEQTHLEVGEILLGYTDGVPEARNGKGEFFTNEKLRLLVEKKAASAEGLLKEISTSVLNHTGSATQFDDITLLAVQRQV
ncbi:MAG: PP2C family protein-serine/threonine phosphatase [Okeania sp. SIO2C2]|uniref:PP2C family protein-serine/threonine phosphatase n=1 Tax=Okeania sp. SIO2C2 TaxID=2607787 RepID=UPI0013BC042C|nr:PP2C family protein-serine/threonine phosphatase [Okeania sp. SIO2C2]NEP90499.1 PP2C family protein-serine/threonine phosphatase [Okeania sp. SIO2C2]